MSQSVILFPKENVNHTKIELFTASTSIISDPVLLAYVDQFAITAFWTGTGTGTFTLQASNDKERSVDQAVDYGAIPATVDPNIVNWVTIPNSSQASSVGSPLMWNYSNVGYRWFRIAYTVATGSITLTVTVQLKGGF